MQYGFPPKSMAQLSPNSSSQIHFPGRNVGFKLRWLKNLQISDSEPRAQGFIVFFVFCN
jgi:hypothetical protein